MPDSARFDRRIAWPTMLKLLIGCVLCLQLSGCVMACFVGKAMSSDCPLPRPRLVGDPSPGTVINPAISPDGRLVAFDFDDAVHQRGNVGLYDWRMKTLTWADLPAGYSASTNLRDTPISAGAQTTVMLGHTGGGGNSDFYQLFILRDGRWVQMTSLATPIRDLAISADGSTAVFGIGVGPHPDRDFDLMILDLHSGAATRADLLSRIPGYPGFLNSSSR